MQNDIQIPRRMPVLCPSCGEIVSAAAPTCTVCGFANPGAPSGDATPSPAGRSCDSCSAPLGPGAKFCRNCGAAVGLKVVPAEPPPDVVVPRPDVEPVVAEHHITFESFDDELDDDLPTLANGRDSLDYLDAQLGLKAPSTDPALLKPPAWRLARDLVPAEEVQDEPPVAPAVPVAAPPAPVEARPSDSPTFTTQVIVGFALFALLIAILVHLVAPSTIPGYSAAELALKVQMRAIEWLLAGVLVALVGLLLKR
jgi:hypothetical protein